MPAIEVEVPQQRFGFIQWRKPNETPTDNQKILAVTGRGEVVAGRYISGSFYANTWNRIEQVSWWAFWPEAPRPHQ